MEYEIDFLPVGEDKKCGDAIALRYGNLFDPNQQTVVVIDGGTKESGQTIVKHIKEYYNTLYVDLVISTHFHQDHASGLTEVLENLEVDKLAMHLPWEHASNIKSMFIDGRLTASGIETKLERSLKTVNELKNIANKKGIDIIEPFQGDRLLDNIMVLSPDQEYYETLVANFENTPATKDEFKMLNEEARSIGEKAIKWIKETLHIDSETLIDSGEDTSPENNTSLVLLLMIDGKKFLFTGDAGKEALYRSIGYAENAGANLNDLHLLDMPHHGSKHNIEPGILKKGKVRFSGPNY